MGAYRPDKLPKILTRDEYNALLETFNLRYITPQRNYLMVRCMGEMGLRSEEVRKLKTEHVDFNTGRTVVRGGKGAKDRVVWMNDDLLEEIQEWMDRKHEGDLLFPTKNGTAVNGRYFRRMVKKAAVKAEISEAEERVSPHVLRHMHGANLYRQTGDLRVTQKALGHSDVSTTQLYTYVADDQVEEAGKNFEMKY